MSRANPLIRHRDLRFYARPHIFRNLYNDEMKYSIDELDTLIRNGKAKEAKMVLLQVKPATIAREHKLAFARVARRVQLSNLVIRTLNPLVRPTGRKLSSATEPEKAEYAAALNSAGASEEALDLLNGLDPLKNPDVLLFKSFALFSTWRYREAIPLLTRYLDADHLSDYARLVGMANLASALVFSRSSTASHFLEDLIQLAPANEFPIVHGYALKLMAENAVWNRQWQEAKQWIEEAKTFFRQSDSLELLFLAKWEAIIAVYENPSRKILSKLDPIRVEATKRSHWETIRSCDYHAAVALKDEQLYARLTFGTPFPSLRDWLAYDFGKAVELPRDYNWKLGDGDTSKQLVLEKFNDVKGPLKAGGSLHRLLYILTEDFYRPLRIAEVHGRMFAQEYFNPNSSPHRVAQQVNRLRAFFRTRKLPLVIHEVRGAYRLDAKHATNLLVPALREPAATSDLRLEKLARAVAGKPFSLQQACKLLALPAWTTRRLLNEAIARGEAERSGSGNDFQYALKIAA